MLTWSRWIYMENYVQYICTDSLVYSPHFEKKSGLIKLPYRLLFCLCITEAYVCVSPKFFPEFPDLSPLWFQWAHKWGLNEAQFSVLQMKILFWDSWNIRSRQTKSTCRQLAPYSGTAGARRMRAQTSSSKERNNSWQHVGMSADKGTVFLYCQTELIMFFVQIQISDRQASTQHVYTDEKRDQ